METQKPWVRITLAVLLIAVAVSGWAVRCRDRQQTPDRDTDPLLAPEPTPIYPLFRAQGYSDAVPDVEFPVEDGRLLVLVIEPVSSTVRLPMTQGTWMATAAMDKGDSLWIDRSDGAALSVLSPGDWE